MSIDDELVDEVDLDIRESDWICIYDSEIRDFVKCVQLSGVCEYLALSYSELYTHLVYGTYIEEQYILYHSRRFVNYQILQELINTNIRDTNSLEWLIEYYLAFIRLNDFIHDTGVNVETN